jgi:hypothetical protein
MKHISLLLLLLCITVSLASAEEGEDSEGKPIREIYAASLTGLGGSLGGKMWSVQLSISAYVEDGERDRFAQILKKNGQDSFLKSIIGEKKGYFRIEGRPGSYIHFAQAINLPDGRRRIVLLFESDAAMFARNASVSLEGCPFTMIELVLDRSGQGEGMIVSAAGIRFGDDKSIELEKFALFPGWLSNVRKETP